MANEYNMNKARALNLDGLDQVTADLQQALATACLLGEQFQSPANRFSDKVLSDAVWGVQERLKAALSVLDGSNENLTIGVEANA